MKGYLYSDCIITQRNKAFKFKGRLGLPIQDILNSFLPSLSLGILPLKYNFQYHPYISAGCVAVNRDQIIDAKKNEIIRHNNKLKPNKGDGDISTWLYYAQLTGFIDEICQQFPRGCGKRFKQNKKLLNLNVFYLNM